jgi:hypothetical protein
MAKGIYKMKSTGTDGPFCNEDFSLDSYALIRPLPFVCLFYQIRRNLRSAGPYFQRLHRHLWMVL